MAKKTRTFGRYELLTLLASGGMAEIHLARQTGIKGFERLVVIKKIHPHMARTRRFVEMFLDEARIAAQLNHPNIVQIFDLGEEHGEYFIAMEYLDGESLAYIMKRAHMEDRLFSPHLAAGITAQACDGLDHAHKHRDASGRAIQIVHRDISPQNIVVLSSGLIKIVDFGIAKAASQLHQTESGTIKGKFSYMAPEHVLSRPLDARSDVFSLGVVLWEMLTFHRLFKRESQAAIVHAVVTDPIPPARQIRPAVPAGISAIADRALAREPEERYQSASDMAAALRDQLRAAGQAAGPAEIAAYLEKLVPGRAETKQRLLQDLRSSRGDSQVALSVLKPDTDESVPGSYGLPRASDQDRAPEEEYSATYDPVLADHAATRRDGRFLEGERRGPRSAGLPRWTRQLMLIAIGLLVLSASILLLWPPTPGQDNPPGMGDAVLHGSPPPQPALEPFGPVRGERNDASSDTRTPPRQAPVSIEVVSQPPGCRAFLDGEPLSGRTPLQAISASPGQRHRLRVLCAGHKPQTRSFAGKEGQHLTMRFAPSPRPARRADGRLKLDTSPWSLVYLGKRKLGMTPLIDVKLPAGTHKLRAVNADAQLSSTIQVTIRPDETTVVFKDLRK
ncbi:MAG: serine/threonine protein kinase [Deltaproteobacteria bacterium]|nr:serine/threonine protein kinase [Deltaproteobacteria bacterium]